MEAAAHLKYAKISVRKARTVLNMVRGRDVATALDQLRFTRKAAAPMVGKLIDSAIANAQQRDENVKIDNLYVKTAFADKASTKMMVRWRPRAQGRATPIEKGLTHMTVILDERAGRAKAPAAKGEAKTEAKGEAKSEVKAEAQAKPKATKAKATKAKATKTKSGTKKAED